MAAQIVMTVAEYRRFGEATLGATRAERAELLDVRENSDRVRRGEAVKDAPPAYRAFGAAVWTLRASGRQLGAFGAGMERSSRIPSSRGTYTPGRDHRTRSTGAVLIVALAASVVLLGVGLALLVAEGAIRGAVLVLRSIFNRGA